MTSITIDDIINDLATVQQASSSSSPSKAILTATRSTRHPLLQLGHSLLPINLRSDHDKTVPPWTSTNNVTGSKDISRPDEDIEKALHALEDSSSADKQSAALHLSSLYLDVTEKTIALNHTRNTSASASASEGQSSGIFDDLHVRIARLQAANESSLSKVQEVRQLIASGDELRAVP